MKELYLQLISDAVEEMRQELTEAITNEYHEAKENRGEKWIILWTFTGISWYGIRIMISINHNNWRKFLNHFPDLNGLRESGFFVI